MNTPNFLEIERHARTLQSAAVRDAFANLFCVLSRALHLPARTPRGAGLGHAH